jgi:hypothetical protein
MRKSEMAKVNVKIHKSLYLFEYVYGRINEELDKFYRGDGDTRIIGYLAGIVLKIAIELPKDVSIEQLKYAQKEMEELTERIRKFNEDTAT